MDLRPCQARHPVTGTKQPVTHRAGTICSPKMFRVLKFNRAEVVS